MTKSDPRVNKWITFDELLPIVQAVVDSTPLGLTTGEVFNRVRSGGFHASRPSVLRALKTLGNMKAIRYYTNNQYGWVWYSHLWS